MQLSLRAFIEQLSINCRFIFTCNYIDKIIEPLRSRCVIIDFKIKKEIKDEISHLFFKRVKEILDIEKIEYEDVVLAKIINKHFHDWRRVLNECQRY